MKIPTAAARSASPASAQPSEAEDTGVLQLLTSVVHSLRAKRLEPLLRQREVTGLQYTLLSVIRTHAGISSADLSRRFYVTPQNMGQLLNSLAARALITRKEDPDNRRVLRIALSAAGQRLVKQCDRDVAKLEAELFGHVKPQTLQLFRSQLRGLDRQLRADDPA